MTIEERSEALKNAGNKKLNLGHFNEVICLVVAAFDMGRLGLIGLISFLFNLTLPFRRPLPYTARQLPCTKQRCSIPTAPWRNPSSKRTAPP